MAVGNVSAGVTMPAALANGLGRPDLAWNASTGVIGQVPVRSQSSGVANSAGGDMSMSGSYLQANLQGRLSLTILAAMIGTMLAFYVWTHPIQR